MARLKARAVWTDAGPSAFQSIDAARVQPSSSVGPLALLQGARMNDDEPGESGGGGREPVWGDHVRAEGQPRDDRRRRSRCQTQVGEPMMQSIAARDHLGPVRDATLIFQPRSN